MIPEGTILLTGGSGFLGRAVLRRAEREKWPCKFIIYSRDEMKQWEIAHRYPNVQCVLGDVARNLDRLIAVCRDVDAIWHMAAIKFIPEAEKNVLETVEINVDGSRNIIAAAIAAGVKRVVGISTDKACAPLNLYGMTKGVMERMFAEANRMGPTRFTTVRYGNVVGSTGSVVPIFRKQIQENGVLRVTDPDMTRFWLSADEAIDLILWAHEEAYERPGATFISRCPSMSIVDLACAIWQMDVGNERATAIEYTGIRPGEKLHEALYNEQESIRIIPDKNGFILAPVSAGAFSFHVDKNYSSDAPDHWVSLDEMVEMIRDAETI